MRRPKFVVVKKTDSNVQVYPWIDEWIKDEGQMKRKEQEVIFVTPEHSDEAFRAVAHNKETALYVEIVDDGNDSTNASSVVEETVEG